MAEDTLFSLVTREVEKRVERLSRGQQWEGEKGEFKRSVAEVLSNRMVCSREKVETINGIVEEVVEAERSLGRRVVVLEVELSSIGLVGTSSGMLYTLLEVGLTWDLVIDAPFVPGSGLKGAVRDVMIHNCARMPQAARPACLEYTLRLMGVAAPAGRIPEAGEVAKLLWLDERRVEDVYRRVGSFTTADGRLIPVGQEGLIVFHDLYLCREGLKPLEGWVLTPHYSRDKAVDEYHAEPVPVVHLVLRPGLTGRLVVGVEPGAEQVLERLLELYTRHLRLRLSGDPYEFLVYVLAATLYRGVGARTSRGYTRLRVKSVKLY